MNAIQPPPKPKRYHKMILAEYENQQCAVVNGGCDSKSSHSYRFFLGISQLFQEVTKTAS
jgi:hypothetical protein